MRKLLTDAFDIACFRIRPLDHYGYPFWQPMLWLSLLATVTLFDSQLEASLPEQFLFYQALVWANTLLMTLFLAWWLRLGKRWNGEGSLFPIVVLCQSANLLVPLVIMLDPVARFVCLLALLIYKISLLVVALSRSTGVGRAHVGMGLLAATPTLLIVFLISQQFALQSGWMPAAERILAEERARAAGQPGPSAPPVEER